MRSFVIGGAGFIGSHLVDRLVQRGPVTVFDNLSCGRREFIQPHLTSGAAQLIVGDALDLDHLARSIADHDTVFHLAANPEARHGLLNTRLDLEVGTIATYNVLEAMRRNNVYTIVFSSSGTVYGETDQACAEEDLGNLPISLYGASKMAGEAMISAFVECFQFRAKIYRFGNVVGPRGTHGAALDFLNRLKADPSHLHVLGDGRQSKPYLFVTDCADGILFGLDHTPPEQKLAVYNLAPPDTTSVARIAELCVHASPNPNAAIHFAGGDRGWPGDVPRSRMNAARLKRLGFQLRMTSDEAVTAAVSALAEQVFGPPA
ncbi:MAG: NAD-dependent epimerase/dehydratase family protein [Polyangiaceae bacterium]|nr:NAD-dependent epimerase/dehydratase family protein [Polyangiaceae bacterium]